MAEVKFTVSKADLAIIGEIVKRAYRIFPEIFSAGRDGIDLRMDLDATHSNGCLLDFQMLLDAPEIDFIHDLGGIARHLDRETGALKDHFRPRCAKPEAEVANG